VCGTYNKKPDFIDRPSLSDEAEGIIVMASSWLALDAIDDWVRHDAEIVRSIPYILPRETKFHINH
jgi:hypothetical protein